jgi:hypothetical protein
MKEKIYHAGKFNNKYHSREAPEHRNKHQQIHTQLQFQLLDFHL